MLAPVLQAVRQRSQVNFNALLAKISDVAPIGRVYNHFREYCLQILIPRDYADLAESALEEIDEKLLKEQFQLTLLVEFSGQTPEDRFVFMNANFFHTWLSFSLDRQNTMLNEPGVFDEWKATQHGLTQKRIHDLEEKKRWISPKVPVRGS